MKKISFIIIYLFLSHLVIAHLSELTFEYISVESGLSNGTVYSIIQDKQGFLWFGTPDGLNRYDGYNFIHYKYDPADPDSISNNNAGNLYLDRSGNIWIGTWGGGLNKFDTASGKFKRFMPDPENTGSISGDRVQTVFEDSSGNIWIGTYQKGLNKLTTENSTKDITGNKWKTYLHDPDDPDSLSNNRVWGIQEDASGNIWVATSNGLNLLDQNSGKFRKFYYDPDNKFSLSNNLIRTLFKSSNGTLWVGTQNGINRFDYKTKRFHRYLYYPDNKNKFSKNTIMSIAEDERNTLWIGTVEGLYHFDPERILPTHCFSQSGVDGSLSQNEVRTVFVDVSGTVWIGTHRGGINKYNPFSQKFDHILANSDIPQSLSDNHVLAILEDSRGVLWVGTDSGLNRSITDRKNGVSQSVTRFKVYKNDPEHKGSIVNNKIWSLYEDRKGILWIGTRTGGISKFLGESETFKNYSHDIQNANSLDRMGVLTIFEDKDDNFWIGSYTGGLYKFDRDTGKFINYLNRKDDDQSLGHNEVWSIYEDKLGSLWIGTGNGLNKFDKTSGKFIRFDLKTKDNSVVQKTRIFSISEDDEGFLWLGTDWGLHRFEPANGEFRIFLEKDGLPNNRILGQIADASGNLWLSTNSGLSRLNIKTETFKNFDSDDGLQGREFTHGAAYMSPDGRMFFGGSNGLNTFYPDKIIENSSIPEIVLTDFKVFNRSVLPGEDSILKKSITETDTITLSFKDQVFSFEFSSLDFASPDYNQYAYKMDGFDKDWIETGADKRYAHYSNLSPGNYVFRVKGSNNDGVWNEKGSRIRIKILPPFWATLAFKFFIAVMGIVLLWVGISFKTRNIRRQNIKLGKMVESRTEELMISEENYRVMIEYSNDIIWTLDKEGKFQYSNKVAEEQTGYTLSDWLGEPFMPMIVEGDLEFAIKMFTEVISGEARHYDLRIYNKNKDVMILSVNTAPFMKNNKIEGTVSFARDVTRERKIENELETYRKDLEKKVMDRTSELESKNLELEEKNEDLGRFFNATIDRELRMKELYERVQELEKKADKKK